MKIAVVSANGRSGRLITNEAVKRGHEVTAIARGENKTDAANFIKKDLFELTRQELAGFDAVVDAAGAWTADTVGVVPRAVKHLADLLRGTRTRLLIVGGAASLFMDKEHTKTVLDVVEFPEAVIPVAMAHQEALDELRRYDDVKWTYVSPAADFQPDGARTGGYILGGEEYTTNERGESRISYADYAIAMLDEIETGGHIGERISVIGR